MPPCSMSRAVLSARCRSTMNEPKRHTDQLDNRIDETLMMLRAAAIEQQMPISGADRVGEACAAVKREAEEDWGR
jgi:hypothetical protein